MTLRRKGFTLVEMLVVIMIIALLAAALFPAITSALNSARSTAAKSKGRGIWAAIVSANAEREPLGLTDLWPGSVGLNSGANQACVYFTYLMSDGSQSISNSPSLAGTTEQQLVSDLKPSSIYLTGPSLQGFVQTSGGNQSLASKNNAWCVTLLQDSDPPEAPLFFTCNMIPGSSPTYTSLNSITNGLTAFNPPAASALSMDRAVWVTRGGGLFDARAKYCAGVFIPSVVTNTYSWTSN